MTARTLSPAVSVRATLTLDQIAQLVEAYGYKPISVGDSHLTAERQVGPKIDVVVFTRAGGAGIAWRGAYFAHGIRGIGYAPDGTPVPERVRAAQLESGMLLTLAGAQDWMARLP